MSDDVLASFSDKASRVASVVALYRAHDYLTAYAKHTDLRVRVDGPASAIGGQWEEYGTIQRDFLIAHGLRPEHILLDLGCGTGRLARKVVPYLMRGRYMGVDISGSAVTHARALAQMEGWADYRPRFVHGQIGDIRGSAHFVWAFSVFTHLPPDPIRDIVRHVARLLTPDGKFLFTYKPSAEPERTGIKQFKYPLSFFADTANEYGLAVGPVDWPASQKCGVMVHA